MLRLLLLLLLLPSSALAQTISFTLGTPQVGDVRSSSEDMNFTLKMTGSVGGQALFVMDNVSEDTAQRVETVTAWAKNKREVDVTYSVVKKVESSSMPEPKTTVVDEPVSGRSYKAVWTKAKGLSVTRLDGSEPTPQEMAQLEDDLEDLSQSDPISTFLSTRSFTVGERVDVPESVFADLFEGDEELEVGGFTLTLRELGSSLGSETAVFDVALTLNGNAAEEGGPPMTMTMPMAGRFIVRTGDTWPVLLELTGPVTATGQAEVEEGVVLTLDGRGGMSMRMDGIYGRR